MEEGRGEEGRWMLLSSVLSSLLRRGERKKRRSPKNFQLNNILMESNPDRPGRTLKGVVLLCNGTGRRKDGLRCTPKAVPCWCAAANSRKTNPRSNWAKRSAGRSSQRTYSPAEPG